MNGSNALYYSFVTLTTMGYGDILPVSRVARMLAILEATTGVLFMSVLIAKLVALYSTVDPAQVTVEQMIAAVGRLGFRATLKQQ